jgi:hypothetical protein
MDTIHVSSWQDMTQFGINCLTGEACAYAMRLLCDLNEDGAGLMMDYLGVPMLGKNWNSMVDGKPAVASVMLHRSSVLQIAEFALMRRSPKAIVYKGGEAIMGVFTQHMFEQYMKLVEDWPNTTGKWTIRTIGRSSQPHVGSRNVHAATGRTE